MGAFVCPLAVNRAQNTRTILAFTTQLSVFWAFLLGLPAPQQAKAPDY